MSADGTGGSGKKALEPHYQFRTAIGMINSLRVLGPDMKLDEGKTRNARRREFSKLKDVLEDYEFCESTGTVIRVR